MKLFLLNSFIARRPKIVKAKSEFIFSILLFQNIKKKNYNQKKIVAQVKQAERKYKILETELIELKRQ